MKLYKNLDQIYKTERNKSIRCKGILGCISGLYVPHTYIYNSSTSLLAFKPMIYFENGEIYYDEATHKELSDLFNIYNPSDRKYKGNFAYNHEKEEFLFYHHDPDVIKDYLKRRNEKFKKFKDEVTPVYKMITRVLGGKSAYIQKDLNWDVPDFIENDQFDKGITYLWITKHFQKIFK